MRQFLCLIFILLCNARLLSQQPKTSENVKFESVEDFILNPEAVREEKLKFYKTTDPSGRYSLEKHQLLWDKNIKLSLTYKPVDGQQKSNDSNVKLKIDAFGLSTTKLMHEQYPELATDLMRKVREEVVGESIDYDDLYELVLAVKKELDQVWARSKDKENDSLIFRAVLVNHHSRVSQKPECWLLVEVFHAKRHTNDLFVRDFMDDVLKGKMNLADILNKGRLEHLFFPGSHPMVEESRFLDKNRILNPNRIDVKVTVHDDKLTIAEREATLGFRLIDESERKYHQIEGCFWSDSDDRRALEALGEASGLLADRVPKGTYLSFDDLHLRLGSVAGVLQRKFPQYILIVTIKKKTINNRDYSSLYLELEKIEL